MQGRTDAHTAIASSYRPCVCHSLRPLTPCRHPGAAQIAEKVPAATQEMMRQCVAGIAGVLWEGAGGCSAWQALQVRCGKGPEAAARLPHCAPPRSLESGVATATTSPCTGAFHLTLPLLPIHLHLYCRSRVPVRHPVHQRHHGMEPRRHSSSSSSSRARRRCARSKRFPGCAWVEGRRQHYCGRAGLQQHPCRRVCLPGTRPVCLPCS